MPVGTGCYRHAPKDAVKCVIEEVSPMPVGTGCYRHTTQKRVEQTELAVANACRHRVLSAPRGAPEADALEPRVANACRHRVLSAHLKVRRDLVQAESRQCLSAQGAIGT